MTPMLVCAHRGASHDHADNSVAAFLGAIDSGCEAIETDVRADGDGRLILAHDPVAATDPDPVTLAELLDLTRGRIGLDLELKERGLEGRLLAALGGWDGTAIVSSFMPRALEAVSALDPDLVTGLLLDAFFAGDPAQAAEDCGAGLLLLEDRLARPEMVRRAGLPVWVWTVNDPRRLSELAQWPEVHGVITDRPELAVRVRSGASSGRQRG